MEKECTVSSESTWRSYIVDLYESFKILVKLLLIFLLCFNCSQTDYTRLLNLKSDLNDSVAVVPNVTRTRIFCLIFTNDYGNDYIAIHGHATWIKNCDRYLFVSNEVHAVLEPLLVKYRDRWDTLKVSLFHVHQYYAADLDWLLIVNDNNYVVLENLRKLLKPYSPDEPINFGCKMKDTDNQTYMRGGIVLSHEALRRLVVEGFTNASLCRANDTPYATEEMGKCLKNLGVVDGDSRDAMGRQRFIPFPPEDYLANLSPEVEEWFAKRSFYEINATTRQLSPEVISFSDVSPSTMVTLHYYIYKLRIFGRKVLPQAQNVTNHLENDTLLS
ncbi:glycoprotein-N-acetylgalactosamine 3-beta-galactosyltransferase 1 isoform X1 [Zeugodacus cucurbitae]|uniref:N-acetylgalactosaminide beta-1,3-galactosyltransferase n=1 Tax=Zeugodacus cucurbitae TaxID=28588 RepID=A0A0A1WV71_ZEUCU|nr:glycoprotein-N-acetylgalactosamine 3-beta-galactosyltransferase 1 isoform X1 [Zeugodacus cucurbitae]